MSLRTDVLDREELLKMAINMGWSRMIKELTHEISILRGHYEAVTQIREPIQERDGNV